MDAEEVVMVLDSEGEEGEREAELELGDGSQRQ